MATHGPQPRGYDYFAPVEGPDVSDQGIDSPDWTPSFTTDGAMSFDHERHGNAGILTIHGIMDAMHAIEHEGEELVKRFLEGDVPHEEMPEWLRRVLPTTLPPPVDVTADINPPRHYSTTTYQIAANSAPALLSARGDRIRATITNTGQNDVLLSWTDDFNNVNTAGEMEAITIPAGNPKPPLSPLVLAASGTPAYNNNAVGVDVTVTGGAVTVIAVNGTTTGLTSGVVFVPAGGTLTITYTSAPTLATAYAFVNLPGSPRTTGNPRMIMARGKIYAWAAAPATVDIIEEYGLLRRQGVYLGPSGG